jgi:SAM-dependent methyltransferase
MTIDSEKLEELVGSMINDLGAAYNAALVITGDRLGLFRAIGESGPLTSRQLAEKTGTFERYIREWLPAQAASGYLNYDPPSDTYSMSPEQIAVFCDEDSPYLLTGGFHGLRAIYDSEPKLTEAFRTGGGVAWGDHCSCLFCGVEKFFKPAYQANLIDVWLPSLDGVAEKLGDGALVADIGCGHGVSTLIMAKAFPNSRFVGFDFHEGSIDKARARAREENLHNVMFEVAAAKQFPGTDYDLVTIFDALHDMGDPVGACRHIARALKPGGTMMVVEPAAEDCFEDRLNPLGRFSYAASAAICVPCSLAQEVGLALGSQAGEQRVSEVIREGGFKRCASVFKDPFNMVLEARL